VIARVVSSLAPTLLIALVGGCGPSLVWFGHSPDRRHRVEVLERRGCQYVSLDGVDGPRFDGVAPQSVVLDDDWSKLAYAGQLGEQCRVMFDGRVGQAWDGIGVLVLGPGGRRVAHAAQRGKRWHVVSDGRVGPEFRELMAGSLRYSPDGQRLAYIGQRGRRSVHAVIDGEVGPAFEGIAALVFSDDGRHVGYIGRWEKGERLVLDGEPGESYDEVSEFAFGVGDRLTFLARDPDGWFAVVAGERGPNHDAVFGLRYTPDGETSAFVARDGGLERVIVGDREEPVFDLILSEKLVFDPRDGRPVYAAALGDLAFVVRGGKPGPAFDRVGMPKFGPGGRLTYEAERGGRGVLVIGDWVIDDYVWAGSLAFSADGERFAFIARKGERTLVLVEAAAFAFDVVVVGSLVFSDDGRSWACLAGSFDERELRLVIDGRTTERIFDWDELIAGVSVDPFAYTKDEDAMALFSDWVAAELALELESSAGGD